ncbi:hypothetical protein BP6252_02665 [Coleophoma cylindrospora]|uniref:DNA helicase n=1 Tax=Coleophoma cylindrospora TaxID=1849047 RepID=A0A3D8SFF6_9HELO|nr:hypothetical protein BP6252_02665 [Coleophoma cylindrospora]
MDSPAFKRQKTDGGFNTSKAGGYTSDADDGDALFENYVPDTPQPKYETQPTQIIDRSAVPVTASSPITQRSTVQVPASSPFAGRDGTPINALSSELGAAGSPTAKTTPSRMNGQSPWFQSNTDFHNGGTVKTPLFMSMAPAGTAYKPPAGIQTAPAKAFINLESDDELPQHMDDSSDDEVSAQASIKPTNFAPKISAMSGDSSKTSFSNLAAGFKYSPNNSFNAQPKSAASPIALQAPGAFKPRQNTNLGQLPTTYLDAQPRKLGQAQTKPEKAKPITLELPEAAEKMIRGKIDRLRQLYPTISVATARNAIYASKGNFEDAAAKLADGPLEEDDDDVVEIVDPTKIPEPQMKRGLNQPIANIRDKYSHTFGSNNKLQPLASASSQSSTPAATPAKPKKRLMQGRRNPSPAPLVAPMPRKAASPVVLSDYGTDSGVESAVEEDPEQESRFLQWLNDCSLDDLIELTNITKDQAELMLAARPFRSLRAAESVEAAPLKSGKKAKRAPIGEKIVDKGLQMFRGYEAVDALVSRCEQLGKPLAAEMSQWGFDVFGAAKDGAGLGLVSLEDDDKESQRDSGIGSPISAVASNNGDDEIKTAGSKRRSRDAKFIKQPTTMADTFELKDYQVVGLNWLSLMYRHKLSCILADDMGLGKTCQVISFLTHLVESGHKGPHLVVLPGSVLENWLREFQKFSPDLVVEPYHGAQADRLQMAEHILEHRDEINVVVSTYELVVKGPDNKFMKMLRPDVAVFDEGHLLKNPLSQRFIGINKIPTQFRLLLTGTPLQNNLQELATLLSFILPQVFHEKAEEMSIIFKNKIQVRDADHGALLSAQRIARARSMLTPFVLRRKKAQVLKHLPAKLLRVQYCSMEPAQKEIYSGHIEEAKERARARVNKTKMTKNENQENNPLMQLRKASIHPLLFRRHFTNDKIEKMADILRKREPENFPSSAKREHLVNEMRLGSDFWLHNWCMDFPSIKKFDVPDLAWMDSGKVTALVELVKGYKENGDRVLIFSQFALVLDILEAVLNTSLIQFTRIDGSTKIDERQTLIDNFRDDTDITAFLLTTKAGGVGLNLAFANKVIIFDGSFNPQDDRQAENRAHRVGQTREVEVVRLVSKGTVEEAIYSLGQSKLMLDGRVAGEEDSGAGADDEEGEAKGVEAVNRMLLEGIGSSEAESATPKDTDVKAEEKIATTDTTLKNSRKSPRKSSSTITSITKASPKTAARETRKRSTKSSMLSSFLDSDNDDGDDDFKADDDGDAMLV